MLPFSQDAFFALFEQYNRGIWPAQIAAYALALAALFLAARPRAEAGRVVSAILALAWAWNGAVYHMTYFVTINFWADIFGLFFIAQALLLVWTGVVRGRLAFRIGNDAASWTGLGLAAFAMIVYPLIGWAIGHGWPRAQLFGVGPASTTIFTMGLLLLAAGRTPLHLALIPVSWSLTGGAMAWFLGIAENLALPAAGIVCVALLIAGKRRLPSQPMQSR